MYIRFIDFNKIRTSSYPRNIRVKHDLFTLFERGKSRDQVRDIDNFELIKFEFFFVHIKSLKGRGPREYYVNQVRLY